MNESPVELLIAAASAVVANASTAEPKSYATWRETLRDEYFDSELAIKSLRSQGHDVSDVLLRQYCQIHHHHHHSPLCLSNISSQAPWIACLNSVFVNFNSFRRLRISPQYIAIITFTTPAISQDGRSAFLEVWSEDGRYPQMGRWWWMQMKLSDRKWSLDWMDLHRFS